eukprot:CAMPEP_0178953208 /NCGR_PEP_ID=MMETSP0789-20121207/8290_1 /TAXON_ID=3005 /ORGANISM="Rhizosolenia setigera, Strain CCMP 1694" /LENGTH=273 /DNA_ID=CAMNT_0020634439 /DNA_START=83 /DNA_END=904 /DNA_ORIENTATION=+
MKRQNDESMKEILTKLNSIEEDNRKLRQELFEMKSSLKHNHNVKLSPRKRDEPEDEATRRNEHSSNKKVRVSVSVASLPPDVPASFDTLDDDCLGNILDFVGKKCYSVFGRVNKRCHEMFCSKGFPKETYFYGYAPLHLILQREGKYYSGLSKAVLHYNRRDVLEWILADDSEDGCRKPRYLCYFVIRESRVDILCEVFDRANGQQLKDLRSHNNYFALCFEAAQHGKLECLKFLRENECEWDEDTWFDEKDKGHEHILQYMRDNGFPTEWQV